MAGHRVLFIVETGWRGARQASLDLIKEGLDVDIVIKGKVEKEILDFITRPGGKYRIAAFSRPSFVVYLFFYLLRYRWGTLKMVIVSKERTRDWVSRFGVATKLLMETENGYALK